jgi:NADH-quinone oxidoreductase subunit L
VFVTLAVAAFLTAFYTMRQITLTFLGKPRTEEAEHAHESSPWMTWPLIVLAVFAVGFGWAGIPEHFPGLGGLIPNYIHDFLAHGLPEFIHLEPIEFSWTPLLTSLGVAGGGLLFGWLMYRNVPSAEEDPLKKALGPVHTLLKNKYYFDEFYDLAFVKTSQWFAETFVFKFMDRGIIDGVLHTVARITYWLGGIFRNYFDLPVINGFIADHLGWKYPQWIGAQLRKIQTGVVQTYMLIAVLVTFGGLFAYLLTIR